MQIDDLHRELGKALAEKSRLSRESVMIDANYHKALTQVLEDRQEASDKLDAKTKILESRINELLEAVKMSEEGMDPLMAKLKARESIEDRVETKAVSVEGWRITSEATRKTRAESALASRITTLESRIS